jgi:nucleoside-diphosphate kinase
MSQRTFSIIKPDAVRRRLSGEINKMIEEAGLRIIAQKMVQWSLEDAREFYHEHKERAFFNDLCDYMSSHPIIVQVLEGSDSISKYRKLMGATNPSDAEDGTIRKIFAISIDENSVHGSDKEESALREIRLIFDEDEIF